MLPPPMTTAVWTPSCWISAMSLRDLRGDGRVDAERLLAHQGFAGEFEEDAVVDGRGGHGDVIIATAECWVLGADGLGACA